MRVATETEETAPHIFVPTRKRQDETSRYTAVCFALGTLQHQWRTKINAPTTDAHPPRTAVLQQCNRGTYSTPSNHPHTHRPTMHTHPPCTAAHQVFMHSLLMCRFGISMFLLSPVMTGIELAHPREHLSTPPARRVGLRCPTFCRRHRGRPCGAGAAWLRGRAGSGGAREGRSLAGHMKTDRFLKIENDTTTKCTGVK